MLGAYRELLSFISPWRQSLIKAVYIAVEFPLPELPCPLAADSLAQSFRCH